MNDDAAAAPRSHRSVFVDGFVVGIANPKAIVFASSPRRLQRVGAFGGLTMIGLGAQLAISGRKD